MRISLPTALTALLLLSDPALARRKKRTVELELDACIAPVTTWITVTAGAAEPTAESASAGVLEELNNGAVAVSTFTVIPLPVTTASGTGNQTAPRGSSAVVKANATSSTIPFFTVQTTASLALPSNLTASIPSTSKSTPTFTTSIIPPTTSSSVLSSHSSGSSSSRTSSSPSPTKTATSSTASAAASTSIPFLRGVNLGGWLVLESWMDSDVFTGAFSSAVDQYTFDQLPGAQAALETHWQTYFTEADISSIAATGINALRIPIGFWAYNNTGTPYLSGADTYLEQAIGWAGKYGMKVWVDCHGSPGSQNGFDNSGQQGVNEWQQGDNLQRSIDVLKIMAKKYGAEAYADVVVGLELTNEPISWGNNVFSVTQSWAQEAYAAVKAEVANENLVIVMHDAFQTPLAWTSIAKGLIDGGKKTFGVDTHLYGLYTDAEDSMTQAQHITEACGWGANLATANAVMPTYVGEWSAATNICVNPDGRTTAGTSCSTAGCQCQSADFGDWNSNMIEAVRKYVEAQMDVFEQSTSGYFMWAAKGPGGWGFLNGIGNGAIPNPVTSRKYAGQCGGSTRRDVRGMLGVGGQAF